MNYYKRHLGDYAKKAGHLTMLEHGAFNLIMDAYYDREKPLTREEAYRVARARSTEEREAVDAVLTEFFLEQEGRFVQQRIEQELAEAAQKAAKNAENGKRGGRPRKSDEKPNETETGEDETESDTSKTQKKPSGFCGESESNPNPLIHKSTNPNNPPKPPGGGLYRFDEFWTEYPRKTGKENARKAWRKIKPDDSLVNEILNAVRSQTRSDQWKRDGGQYIPHPATWLNGKRWEDEIPDPEQPPPGGQIGGGLPVHRAGGDA